MDIAVKETEGIQETMPIIYFFGPDGTGKTTLARLLIHELRIRGFKVRYSWMRGSHTLASLFSRFLYMFNSFRGGFNPYYGISIPKRMVRLWWFLEYVSALPIILIKFILPSFARARDRIVVADRYVLDLIVWITLVTKDDSFLKSLFARHLILLALRSEPRFLTIADLRELAKRRTDDMAMLKRQLDLYKSLDIDSYVIDTTDKSPDESIREILRVLQSYGFK